MTAALRVAAAAAIAVAGCATIPTAPRVIVLPGAKKSLAQFQSDDAACRGSAAQRLEEKVEAAPAARSSATAGAGETAAAPPLAAFGAAALAQRDHWSAQDRFDVAYLQCMYANGNQVPIPRGFVIADPTAPGRHHGLPAEIPPPPEGIPPPPPSGPVR